MENQTGGAKPSKPLGIIVAVVMLSYAFYALYAVIRVKTNYKKEAVGIVKNIEASFVPGNKVYVSQFSNIVTYEFTAGGAAPKMYGARVDSIMMCTKKAGDEIIVYYDETAPEKFNIPMLAMWGDIMLFVVLSSIGSTLMWYMLKM